MFPDFVENKGVGNPKSAENIAISNKLPNNQYETICLLVSCERFGVGENVMP